MEENKMLKKRKEKTVLVLLSIFTILISFSCASKEEVEYFEVSQNGCFYLFSDTLDYIYGTWEPRILIDNETGDSTFYEIGEGRGGFMFGDRYADSFELRANDDFAMYYVSIGRPCIEKVSGSWEFDDGSSLKFYHAGDTIDINVLYVNEEELIIEDVIEFKESKSIMRRVN